MTKMCQFCNTVLTEENKVHWRTHCKSCQTKQRKIYYATHRKNDKAWENHKKSARTYYQNNKKRVKNTTLLRLYGISLQEYAKMLESQHHKCAICGQPEKSLWRTGRPKELSVDHSHKTGKVRALLCHACNTGIGAFEENSQLLNRAANYLAAY
jgi:ribosomal protein L34E